MNAAVVFRSSSCRGCLISTQAAATRNGRSGEVAAQYPGAMFAVQGLSREEVEHTIERTGSSVDVACHTSRYQMTLSGLESELIAIKAELEGSQPNVRVHKINTFGVAFHSKHISATLLARLENDLHAAFGGQMYPKLRSSKWVSTCYEPGDLAGANVDAVYHCQGFRNCVEFERACKHISNDGLIVECGPHALFRSVFVRDGHQNVNARYLPLATCGCIMQHWLQHAISVATCSIGCNMKVPASSPPQ